MSKHIPIPLNVPPSDDVPEYKPAGWDDPPDPQQTEQDHVKAELSKLTDKTIPESVSAQLQVTAERVVKKSPAKILVANKMKVGRKPTGCAMTNAQRQAKWRAANRPIALERQRAAMKKIRDAQKDIE